MKNSSAFFPVFTITAPLTIFGLTSYSLYRTRVLFWIDWRMRAGCGELAPLHSSFEENMTHEFAPLRLWPVAAHAGFPSPGEEYREPALNLHDLVVQNPHATYFIRARGQSMRGAGISPGDVIVVDRSLTARHNQLAVVRVGDHLVIKRLLV